MSLIRSLGEEEEEDFLKGRGAAEEESIMRINRKSMKTRTEELALCVVLPACAH